MELVPQQKAMRERQAKHGGQDVVRVVGVVSTEIVQGRLLRKDIESGNARRDTVESRVTKPSELPAKTGPQLSGDASKEESSHDRFGEVGKRQDENTEKARGFAFEYPRTSHELIDGEPDCRKKK